MKIAVCLIILICAFNATAQPSVENVNKSRAEFRQGMQKGAENKFEEALEHFNEAIKLNPIYAEAFLYRGISFNELGKYDKAITDLTICIELDPKFSDQAHYFRGIAKFETGNYPGAIQDYTTAIQLNPDFVAFYRRGQANMNLNEYARALQDFQIAIRLNPSFIEGFLYRGKALYYLGQYEEALSDLRRAAMDLRNNPVAYYYSGVARMETRDFYGAIRDFDKAIDINPEYAKALKARAVAHAETGNQQKSEEDINLADKLAKSQVEKDTEKPHLAKGETTLTKRKEEDYSRPMPDFASLFGTRDEKTTEEEKKEDEIMMTMISEPISPETKESKQKKHSEDEETKQPTEIKEKPAKSKVIKIESLKPGFYNKKLAKHKPSGFGVQLASYSNTDNLVPLITAYEAQFNKPVFIQVSLINNNKIYRLIVGEFDSRIKAELLRDKLRKNDFPDCFLIVYENLY